MSVERSGLQQFNICAFGFSESVLIKNERRGKRYGEVYSCDNPAKIEELTKKGQKRAVSQIFGENITLAEFNGENFPAVRARLDVNCNDCPYYKNPEAFQPRIKAN
jgi:hypothetical protein